MATTLTKYIITPITNKGNPISGLTPSIVIYDVSDNSIVLTDTMTEIDTTGTYKFVFSTYDRAKSYYFRIDAGASQPKGERYYNGTNEEFSDAVIVGIGQGLPSISFE